LTLFYFSAQEEELKRKDAFRKLRTICQRLDEVELNTFEVQPLRLYLFGSVLTDKPFPNNIDLLLVHEYIPNVDYDKFLGDLANRRPVLEQRLAIHLRRGMQQVRVFTARTALETWGQRSIFLVVRPRLIWEPGGNWRPVIDDIEQNPLPWLDPLPEKAKDRHEAFINTRSSEAYHARLAEVLAEIEGQKLQAAGSLEIRGHSDAAGVGHI
jgi:hypothetical protein